MTTVGAPPNGWRTTPADDPVRPAMVLPPGLIASAQHGIRVAAGVRRAAFRRRVAAAWGAVARPVTVELAGLACFPAAAFVPAHWPGLVVTGVCALVAAWRLTPRPEPAAAVEPESASDGGSVR